jgi:xylulokinase
MDLRAAKVPAGSNGVIFLPYLHGDRTPHQDPAARSVFFGLANGLGVDEMIRAIMEGVVFSMNEGVQIARDLGATLTMAMASGGGARSRLWRQLQADIFELPVTRSIVSEQGCTGAAILAAVGCGLFADIQEACGAMTRMDPEVIEPNAGNAAIYKEVFGIYRELYQRNKDIFPRLGKLSDKL